MSWDSSGVVRSGTTTRGLVTTGTSMESVVGTRARANSGAAVARHGSFRPWPSLLVVLVLLPCVADAADGKAYADLPIRKPGLWEVTIDTHVPPGAGARTQPAMTALQCTDAGAERIVPLFLLPARDQCRQITVSRNGSGHEVNTVCETHGQRVDTQVKVRGDMQARYDGTYRIRYAGTPSNDTGQVPFKGRWLGRCKPGQRAGDMVLPNGITVNTVDDARRASGHAH